MIDTPEPFAPFEPELLVATCSPQGELVSANDAWQALLGSTDEAWTHLSPEDQDLARLVAKTWAKRPNAATLNIGLPDRRS